MRRLTVSVVGLFRPRVILPLRPRDVLPVPPLVFCVTTRPVCLSPGQARRDESDLARLLDSPQYSHLLRALEDREATTPLDVAGQRDNSMSSWSDKFAFQQPSSCPRTSGFLRSLKQSTGLSDSDLREIFSTKSRQERNKKNLLGHWCSQGLSVTRDPCEVFQKLKLRLVREARMEADQSRGS